jgi:DNA repair exonuclease SbcCD ATPase subunit
MTPMERIEGELSDAQKRIAELERRNVGLAKECQAQQEQITELKNALTRQARAAKTGMDAAKKHGSHMESEAKRLHAECNPEALESEREANAKLTELVAELERERDAYRAAEEMQVALRQKAEEREAALAAHVERLDALSGRVLHECPNWADSPQSIFLEMLAELRGESPATALTHRDLIKQAEALELVNCQSGPQEDTPQEDAFDAGWDAAFELIRQFASELRQQAEAINESPA